MSLTFIFFLLHCAFNVLDFYLSSFILRHSGLPGTMFWGKMFFFLIFFKANMRLALLAFLSSPHFQPISGSYFLGLSAWLHAFASFVIGSFEPLSIVNLNIYVSTKVCMF